MAMHRMGPIRCRDAASAEACMAAISAAVKDPVGLHLTLSGAEVRASWEGPEDVAEVISKAVRPFTRQGSTRR